MTAIPTAMKPSGHIAMTAMPAKLLALHDSWWADWLNDPHDPSPSHAPTPDPPAGRILSSKLVDATRAAMKGAGVDWDGFRPEMLEGYGGAALERGHVRPF